MDKDLLISSLQLQNAKLVERVDELEKAIFGSTLEAPPEWKLTASESRVFCALASREVATKEFLLVALYDDTFKDRAEPKIVDVYVCKLRKKLKLYDVSIETIWGKGYRLPERERFQRAA